MDAIEKLKKKLESKQLEIAKNRDDLREFVGEVEDILESLDAADEDLQDAIASLNCAVDTLSQYQ